MDEVALANYLAGIESGPLLVTNTPRELAATLGVPVGAPVYLSDYTLTKSRYKHQSLDVRIWRHIGLAIWDGFAITEKGARKSRIISLIYNGTESLPYLISLKGTSNKEVFVSTFHRIHLKEARRHLNQGRKRPSLVLRSPKRELAQLLSRRASCT